MLAIALIIGALLAGEQGPTPGWRDRSAQVTE